MITGVNLVVLYALPGCSLTVRLRYSVNYCKMDLPCCGAGAGRPWVIATVELLWFSKCVVGECSVVIVDN